MMKPVFHLIFHMHWLIANPAIFRVYSKEPLLNALAVIHPVAVFRPVQNHLLIYGQMKTVSFVIRLETGVLWQKWITLRLVVVAKVVIMAEPAGASMQDMYRVVITVMIAIAHSPGGTQYLITVV